VLKLVRRPRTREAQILIRKELRKELKYYYTYFPRELNKQLAGWKQKPTFKVRINIGAKVHTVEVRVDRRTRIGKIFGYVDQGTGIDGPKGQPYPIEPVNADMLIFDVPYQPATLPVEPLRYNPNAPETTVTSLGLMHPGIQKRDFTGKVREPVDKRSGVPSFRRRCDKAYRKGMREASKLGGKPV